MPNERHEIQCDRCGAWQPMPPRFGPGASVPQAYERPVGWYEIRQYISASDQRRVSLVCSPDCAQAVVSGEETHERG